MVTIGQVAARAKVSQATVSHVLGGNASRLKISHRTQKRVLEVVQELGYHRNLLARAIVTGKSHMIGLVTPVNAGENIIQILAGAMEATIEYDYLLKVIHLSPDESNNDVVTHCMEWRLAGAIIVGLRDDPQHQMHDQFQQAQLPLAVIESSPLPEWGVRFRSDDLDGIGQVVTHLAGLGHRRIAFLGGAPCELSTWRTRCFRSAMADANLALPTHWVEGTSWSHYDLIAADAQVLLREDRPTAIVCSCDHIAMVVLREARAMGLRLPTDLSVTGYAGTRLSSYIDPPLTTVHQPFQAMGRDAALHLIHGADLAALKRPLYPCPEMVFPTQLIVRSSTAPPPSKS